jgi:predicted transcriptional regulator
MKRILDLFRRSPNVHFGPLEQQLLSTLWTRGSATVREIVDGGEINLAYTTVMTTLDRLFKKQILNRVAEGRAFRYSPRYSQTELEKAAVGETIRQLLGSSAGAASLPLSYLVEAVSEHDAALLDDLQRLLDQKRRELRSEIRSDRRSDDHQSKEAQ